MIPAGFALVAVVSNMFIDLNVNPFDGLFSAFMAIWGTLYITSWRRRTHELDALWDTYTVQTDFERIRKDFKGRTRINQVTDQPELYFTTLERLPLYL
jgi:hypothetical protein